MKIHLTYITKYLSAALLFVTVPSSGQNAFMKVVAQDGTGDYRSINEAVGSCTQDGTRNFIFIKNGTYEEQVKIPKGITLSIIGENRDKTVITHSVSHASGLDKEETSTIYVEAFDLYGENFTTQHTAGRNGGQAECITNSGDRMTFRNVAMKANQDGVRFDHASRSYMKDCYIEGTVDYIYDSGIAFLDNCEIKQLYPGYIVAPGNSYVLISRTESKELCGQSKLWNIGITIRDSRLTCDEANVKSGASYLGRPWGKTSSAAMFIRCKMDSHINAAGFTNMSEGTKTYIGEYQSMDLGGNPIDVSKRISWEFTEDPAHNSQYIDERVINNIYDMERVYTLAGKSGARAGGEFNPIPLVTPVPAPAVACSGGKFTWQAADGAAGYLIYKNGRYLCNTAATEFEDTDYDSSARYTLRTVSATGCLGDEADMTATGIDAAVSEELEIKTSADGIYWNTRAKAMLYSASGLQVASTEGTWMSWGNLPRGCYILKVVTGGKDCIVRKIMKRM